MRRLLAGLAVIPCCVFAQQADPVVVTATRVDQPSLEIPAAIDRVYGEELQQGRPQVNLSESLGRVPGLVVLNRQNYAQDLQVSSRGFGARATFGVRGIRLIADGIPASMPDGQGQAATFDLGSASRIEVLRGPFSALYGNASGGVINVLTEDAPPAPTLSGGGYAGSYDTRRAALKFGARRGALGSLFNLSHFESDGYRDHSAARRDQLNAKLTLPAGGEAGLTLVGTALYQPDTQDPLGLTAAQVAQNPRQADPLALQFNTRKSIAHDQIGATLERGSSGGARLSASAWAGTRDVRQYLGFAGTGALSSGGVVDLDREFGGAALRLHRDAALGGRPLKLAVGLEYERMVERRRGFENLNGVAGALKRDEDNTVASTGLFAQGEWQFAERWSAHAGLRSTRVAFETDDFFIGANPDDSGSKHYSATTPVAGIVFKVDAQTSWYANYGRGFETPTFVELAYRNGGTGLNFALEPARSRHVETGLKAVRAGLGRLNLALFDIETRNEIVVDQALGDGRNSFRNAGRTRRRGLELGAETLIAGPFEARAAYTWLDAEFEEDFGTSAAGNRLPGVPKEQLYAEGAWRHAPLGLRVALELLHRARVPVNDQNSEYAPSFTVVSAVVGFEQQGAGWRVTEFLRVDNVGDKTYIGSVIVNANSNRFYEPAPRRNILLGVQASLQF